MNNQYHFHPKYNQYVPFIQNPNFVSKSPCIIDTVIASGLLIFIKQQKENNKDMKNVQYYCSKFKYKSKDSVYSSINEFKG